MRIARRGVVGLLASGAFAMFPAAVQAQNMAVPNYIYPPWSQMDAGAPVVSLSVMNPNSGPGSSVNSDYASAVKTAQSAGVRVLGYVWTNYAGRSLAAAEADITAYYNWYKVDGIFLDGASTSCLQEPYYATLYTFIKDEGGLGRVIINPGEQTSSCYTAAADTIVNFEGSYSQYVGSYSAPSWVRSASASEFWQIIYGTSTSHLSNAVALSKARNAGYVYVTSYGLPNPYGALPSTSYWKSELTAIG